MKLPRLSELSITQRANLFEALRVEITHHSNKIEGVSLEYGETKNLLTKGITASNKPLSDHLVILGFAKAYDEITRSMNNKYFKLSSSYIKDIHSLLFSEALSSCPDKIERPIGAYRSDERHIKGVDIKLSSPLHIRDDLENLLAKEPPVNIEDIANFHIEFETIHPFADGNGRVGRLLMLGQFVQNDMMPPLIKEDFRKEYLESMNNKDKLSNFLKKAQKESCGLIGISLEKSISKHKSILKDYENDFER